MPRSATRRLSNNDRLQQQRAALWAARLLVRGGGHRNFIRRHGATSDELLEFLDLGELEDAELSRAAMLRRLRQRYRELADEPKDKQTLLERNTARLAARLGLNAVEEQLLVFFATSDLHPELKEAIEFAAPRHRGKSAQLLATVLELPAADIALAIRRNSKLARAGLVKVDHPHFLARGLEYDLLDGLAPALLSEFDQLETAFEGYFTPAGPAQLSGKDFPHIELDYQRLRQLLAHARKATDLTGLNILIYGAPGVGKTELAKALAADLEAQLVEIAIDDEDGDSLSGERRFRSLSLCQHLLHNNREFLILFDEVEDVFAEERNALFTQRRRQAGKAWTNRQLEQNSVPTFWLSNSIGGIDPAHLRRFDYVLELKAPPRNIRRDMLASACAELAVSPQWVDRMAEHEAVTPAQIAQAARVARLVGELPGDSAEALMQAHLERQLGLQGHRPPPRRQADAWLPYALDCVRTDADLAAVTAGLARSGRGSLLLYGPPGTGKTAYAHHLAQQLDRPLIKKSASELLSKWLGETEQAIAAMFAAARADGAVLLLDEADSFLRSRQSAEHSWQITQVNEMLVRMESFDGVFVCATNFLEITDEAALRRFDLKLRLDYPDAAQRWKLFLSLLERLQIALPAEQENAARAALARLENLAPGDFATVARRWSILAPADDAAAVLAALDEESRIKPDARRRPVGFLH